MAAGKGVVVLGRGVAKTERWVLGITGVVRGIEPEEAWLTGRKWGEKSFRRFL